MVLVRGQFARMVGAINMDSLLIDVTDIADAASVDEVVLIGGQGRRRDNGPQHSGVGRHSASRRAQQPGPSTAAPVLRRRLNTTIFKKPALAAFSYYPEPPRATTGG